MNRRELPMRRRMAEASLDVLEKHPQILVVAADWNAVADDIAVAILDAMREPDDEMWRSGMACDEIMKPTSKLWQKVGPVTGNETKAIWKAMIDAIKAGK